jgi:hypothetical protein
VTSEPDTGARHWPDGAAIAATAPLVDLIADGAIRSEDVARAEALEILTAAIVASPVVSVAQLREWIEEERTRNLGMYRDTVQGDAYAQGDAHAIGRLSARLDDLEGES